MKPKILLNLLDNLFRKLKSKGFYSTGFTLIELLVVIAIIALLASIIVINLKGSIERAKIAKALQWSQSVHSLLGANILGEWNFNEGSGTTANDGSGKGNDGTIYEATYTNDTPNHALGTALKFDGDNDYVRNSSPSGLNFASTNEITIEAWFKLTGHTNYDGIVSINDGSCAYRIMANPDMYPYWDPGQHSDQYTTSYTFELNNWYYYVMTVKGGGNSRIYINGELIDERPNGVPATLPDGADILIGTGESPAVHLAQGIIDEVRIYNRTLPSSAIKAQYYAGLNTLLAKHKIDQQEFQERILADK